MLRLTFSPSKPDAAEKYPVSVGTNDPNCGTKHVLPPSAGDSKVGNGAAEASIMGPELMLVAGATGETDVGEDATGRRTGGLMLIVSWGGAWWTLTGLGLRSEGVGASTAMLDAWSLRVKQLPA